MSKKKSWFVPDSPSLPVNPPRWPHYSVSDADNGPTICPVLEAKTQRAKVTPDFSFILPTPSSKSCLYLSKASWIPPVFSTSIVSIKTWATNTSRLNWHISFLSSLLASTFNMKIRPCHPLPVQMLPQWELNSPSLSWVQGFSWLGPATHWLSFLVSLFLVLLQHRRLLALSLQDLNTCSLLCLKYLYPRSLLASLQNSFRGPLKCPFFRRLSWFSFVELSLSSSFFIPLNYFILLHALFLFTIPLYH